MAAGGGGGACGVGVAVWLRLEAHSGGVVARAAAQREAHESHHLGNVYCKPVKPAGRPEAYTHRDAFNCWWAEPGASVAGLAGRGGIQKMPSSWLDWGCCASLSLGNADTYGTCSTGKHAGEP